MKNTGKELLQNVLNDLPELAEGKNVAIALSGGLDSTTLVYCLVEKYGADKVKALSFNFGQRHTVELEMAKKTVDKLGIEWNLIDLDYFPKLINGTSALLSGSELKPKTAEEEAGNPQAITYVPFRNMQFASITAAYAESYNCSYIAQGIQASDGQTYWDTTLGFTKAINDVLSLNRLNVIKFISPFVEIYKDEELKMAKELSERVGYNILKNTWSCYNGYKEEHNFKECGSECTTCSEKLLAYIQAGFTNDEIMDQFNVGDEYIEGIRKEI